MEIIRGWVKDDVNKLKQTGGGMGSKEETCLVGPGRIKQHKREGRGRKIQQRSPSVVI